MVDLQLPKWTSAKGIGDPLYNDWLRDEYRWVIDILTARGARIVWLSALCAKGAVLDPKEYFDPRRVLELNRLLEEVLKQEGQRAEFVDLFSEVCPDGSFSRAVYGVGDGRPDGVHFSPEAADRLVERLAPRLMQR